MAKASTTQKNDWQGPAFLSYGFRPFFLLGSLWAGLAMILWIPLWLGAIEIPTQLDALSWHTHAFLFGYLGAIIAGFLLTAVPNWTGRAQLTGWPLAFLVLLWIAGRIALLTSAHLTATLVAIIDVAFPLILSAFVLRELIASQNWRNLIIVALVVLFAGANLFFHWEAAHGEFAAQGIGFRLGLVSVLLMVAIIGGRIVPAFTRNWLTRVGKEPGTLAPMQPFDKLVLLVSLPVFLAWVLWPEALIVGSLLLLAGLGHLIRLLRWKGFKTTSEPLVFVLHLGYLFLPLGTVAMGIAILFPDFLTISAAQHLWTAGALGVMTLAVMTRASLGHTGRPLKAGKGTILLYAALITATLLRFATGFWPDPMLYHMAATFWVLAFGGFAVLYGRLLLGPVKPRSFL